MKRFLALIICVCVLAAAQTAMAASDDKVLLRAGSDGVDAVSVVSLAYLNGTMYIMCKDKLYAYDGELKAYEYRAPAMNASAKAETLALMLEGGALRALVSETNVDTYDIEGLTLYKLEITPDGAAEFGEPLALDHRALTVYGERSEYLRYIENPFIQDGRMVFLSHMETERAFTSYDLISHDVTDVIIENLSGVIPYEQGEALAIINGDDAARFCALDIASGEARELFGIRALNHDLPKGAVYDARTGDMYYIQNGELYKIEDMRPETAAGVNTVNLNSVYKQPAFTEDGFYVACDFDMVIMCNTAPAVRGERRLVIEDEDDEAVRAAFYSFSSKHADVDVRLIDVYGDIRTDMLTRNDSIDIYYLLADNYDYMSMLERGYLAELSQSQKLTDFVKGMYPSLREAVEKDGELYALPVDIETFEILAMKNSTMEKLGLTRDDMPKTWMELFEFFREYPALAEANPGAVLFESDMGSRRTVKYTIMNNIWRDYMIYMQKQPDADMSFNTPLFRELLSEFQAIDYDALGVPVGEQEYTPNDLIMLYGYLSAEPNNYSRYTPMPLAITEGAPASMSTQLRLLVVNPYSQNRELAIEFLEEVVDHMPALTLTHLLEYYDNSQEDARHIAELERMNAILESLRAAEAAANEAEKLVYQERISEQLENIENYKYNNIEIAAASVLAYRKYAQYLVPNLPINIDRDNLSEINSFISRYSAGAIDMETMIKGIDGRLRMILLEGA